TLVNRKRLAIPLRRFNSNCFANRTLAFFKLSKDLHGMTRFWPSRNNQSGRNFLCDSGGVAHPDSAHLEKTSALLCVKSLRLSSRYRPCSVGTFIEFPRSAAE